MEFVIATIAATLGIAAGFIVGVAAGRKNDEVKVPPGEPLLLIPEQKEVVELKSSVDIPREKELTNAGAYMWSLAKSEILKQAESYIDQEEVYDPAKQVRHIYMRLRVVKGANNE